MTVGAVLARLTDIARRVSRPRGVRPPGDEAVAEARRLLRRAERSHRARVRKARRALVRAEKRHAKARRAAERRLQAAERREENALRQAQGVVDAVHHGHELARFGPLRLSDGEIAMPAGREPLSPSVQAWVEPAATLVAARRGTLMRLAAQGDARGEVLRDLERHPDRLYLLVETPGLAYLASCNSKSEEARRFAELVNVAALNAERFADRRRGALGEVEAELDQIRESGRSEIERARVELAQVEAAVSEIEEARRELARVEADIADVERCREELRRAELRRIESGLGRDDGDAPG